MLDVSTSTEITTSGDGTIIETVIENSSQPTSFDNSQNPVQTNTQRLDQNTLFDEPLVRLVDDLPDNHLTSFYNNDRDNGQKC